jgi:pimeloyl-ACP methyl ester carboxylesterase
MLYCHAIEGDDGLHRPLHLVHNLAAKIESPCGLGRTLHCALFWDVKGSGHWLMEERPAETMALIRSFLEAARPTWKADFLQQPYPR